jgi:hypothetical protein
VGGWGNTPVEKPEGAPCPYHNDLMFGLVIGHEIELQEQGIAVPSTVVINCHNYLHVAITNHRSRKEDFELLVREVIRLGNEYYHNVLVALPLCVEINQLSL